jgi:hypothetical protein
LTKPTKKDLEAAIKKMVNIASLGRGLIGRGSKHDCLQEIVEVAEKVGFESNEEGYIFFDGENYYYEESSPPEGWKNTMSYKRRKAV